MGFHTMGGLGTRAEPTGLADDEGSVAEDREEGDAGVGGGKALTVPLG